ncbi:hypothetical protein [uncultured phage MedDCM-OCT-S09-C28]|nr:hypothetical protein [uncultured phage MedDCM-OCT-S09-C28]
MKALEKTVEKLNADLLKNAAVTKKAGAAAGTATGNIQRMGIAFRTTLGPIVATYAAINFLSKSLQVASQRQVNVAKLTNGLENLGGTAADLENLVDAADKFGRATLFDQEDATQAFALLTSFQRIGVESYERVTKAASDLATVTGTDLKSAQIQLAKALEDPAKRVTDLARSGTVFTDQQKEQIKVLQESGRLFEAQDLILQEIEKQYGGAAEAAGSAGLAGALDTLGEATRDFQEELVTGTGTINLAEAAILQLAGAIDVATGKLKEVELILNLLDGLLQNATGSVNGLAGAWDFLTESIINSVPAVRDAIRAYEFLLKVAGKYNDQQAGGRNFGSNYASQEEALFKAAGGYLPPKPTPKPTPTPITATTGSGSKSSGADAAAKAAEREAERVAKTLRDREQLVERLEQQIKIQNQVTDLGKEEQKLQLQILEINQRYDNLLAEETNELIRQKDERARILELTLAQSEAQQSMMSAAQSDFTNFLKQQPEYAKAFNDELTDTEQLLNNAYGIVANGLTSGITGLIDGTKEWGDVLGDIASQLGSMLLNFGFNMLGAGIGIPGFADGGRPPTNMPSIVGERGPELFVPDSAGTVLSNEQTKDALATYSPANAEMSSAAPMTSTINYNGPTLKFNGNDYIPRSEASSLVNAGAKQGEQRAMNRLRQSRSSRSKIGI